MGSSTYFPGDRSPFRTGFLKVALFIAGAWVDVSTSELGSDGVTITRGRAAGSTQSEPSSCTFRLKDPTGKWSPRHPSSTYYGKIGRGTPVRVQTETTAGAVLDRWYGEVVTWSPKWTRTGARDAYVVVECAGVIRRLGQGASPLRSPLYRSCSTLTPIVAYWPLEDGASASALTAAIGGRTITVTGSPSLAGYSAFPGSAPIPTLQDGRLVANVPAYTPGSPAKGQVRWVGRIPSTTPNNAVLMRVRASGTLGYVEVRYSTGGGITVEGFADGGASVGSNLYGMGVDNAKMRYSLELTQSGANISWSFGVLTPGATSAGFGTGTFTGVTLGTITQVDVNPNRTALGDLAFGHLTVEKDVTSLFAVSSWVLAGWAGEDAGARITRLCGENGVTVGVFSVATPQYMGVQGIADLLTLLRQCEDTDGGILYEPKSTTDLGYRTGESLYSQVPVTLAYVDNVFGLEPVEDDQGTRNKVTVTRDGGGAATYVQTTGTLGTATVGTYDAAVTLSLYADADALDQAAWRVHLGTHDEARFPTISVDLADPRVTAALRNQLLGIDLGTRVDITNLPAWLPPFTVSQLVVGYTEQITPLSYRLTFNCVPARPYRVGYWNSGGADRYSGEGTVLAADITTTTATTFTTTNPAGVTWTSADGSYDVLVNGEQMTVTSVTGGNSFTVTRGVNGVRKTHATNSAVTLADPCYYGF